MGQYAEDPSRQTQRTPTTSKYPRDLATSFRDLSKFNEMRGDPPSSKWDVVAVDVAGEGKRPRVVTDPAVLSQGRWMPRNSQRETAGENSESGRSGSPHRVGLPPAGGIRDQLDALLSMLSTPEDPNSASKELNLGRNGLNLGGLSPGSRDLKRSPARGRSLSPRIPAKSPRRLIPGTATPDSLNSNNSNSIDFEIENELAMLRSARGRNSPTSSLRVHYSPDRSRPPSPDDDFDFSFNDNDSPPTHISFATPSRANSSPSEVDSADGSEDSNIETPENAVSNVIYPTVSEFPIRDSSPNRGSRSPARDAVDEIEPIIRTITLKRRRSQKPPNSSNNTPLSTLRDGFGFGFGTPLSDSTDKLTGSLPSLARDPVIRRLESPGTSNSVNSPTAKLLRKATIKLVIPSRSVSPTRDSRPDADEFEPSPFRVVVDLDPAAAAEDDESSELSVASGSDGLGRADSARLEGSVRLDPESGIDRENSETLNSGDTIIDSASPGFKTAELDSRVGLFGNLAADADLDSRLADPGKLESVSNSYEYLNEISRKLETIGSKRLAAESGSEAAKRDSTALPLAPLEQSNSLDYLNTISAKLEEITTKRFEGKESGKVIPPLPPLEQSNSFEYLNQISEKLEALKSSPDKGSRGSSGSGTPVLRCDEEIGQGRAPEPPKRVRRSVGGTPARSPVTTSPVLNGAIRDDQLGTLERDGVKQVRSDGLGSVPKPQSPMQTAPAVATEPAPAPRKMAAEIKIARIPKTRNDGAVLPNQKVLLDGIEGNEFKQELLASVVRKQKERERQM